MTYTIRTRHLQRPEAEQLTPDYKYGIDTHHGRHYICLLQEDGRSVRQIGDGFDSYDEALDAWCNISGQRKRLDLLNYVIYAAFGLMGGGIVGAWLCR